ncbi:hypothetical protein AAG570_011879 [Ranatra chinensis]|uniref:Uncharacterized protein n=1 Tax=Ranatra chinensis TaxID=642074 RepID=A0ABD0YHA3_9HEMI
MLGCGWCQRPTGINKRHDVYIAGFFPYGRHVAESHVGRGVMPAVKLAVDHINESPTVLRNYRLHMWWNDTEVSFNSSIQILVCMRLPVHSNCLYTLMARFGRFYEIAIFRR